MKVGVIGVGRFGKHHVRVWKEIPNVDLIGIYDIDVSRAINIAQKYGTKWFDSLDALLDNVEAVSIASSTPSHYPIAKRALSKGIHTFVEKPLAQSLEEVDDLIQLARSKNLVLQVGHIERFNPAIIALEELLREPIYIEAYRSALRAVNEISAPLVLDLMVHDIDIVLKFVKSEIEQINATGLSIFTPEEYDLVNARIEFKNGVVANLTASRVVPETIRRIIFFEKDRYFFVDYKAHTAVLYYRGQENNGYFSIKGREIETIPMEPLHQELESFTESVIKGKPPVIDPMEVRKSFEVAYRVLKSLHLPYADTHLRR